MIWQELADQLRQELGRLFGDELPSLRSLVPDSADAASSLASIDEQLQKGIGRTVFEYAMTGQWPEPLLPAEKTLLFYRLKFGIALAQSLADNRTVGGEKLLANLPDNPGSRADLVQWLLEYAWDEAGHQYTVAVCAGLRGAEPSVPAQN